MAKVTAGVGDPIRSNCTKCKRATRHWVVALVEDKPARVQCTECDGIHNYRPAKAPARARATPVRRRPATAAAKAEAAVQEFEAATAGMDPERATAYRMDGTFAAKKLLQHPTFGLGLVRRVIRPNKIEVLFRDRARTLRCAG